MSAATAGARVALVTWQPAAATPPWSWAEADGENRALAASLGRLGVAAEQVAWSEPAVDWSSYDLVMVRTTWDYFDRLAEFRAWIARAAAAAPLWNPAGLIGWNADKRYLFELEAAGVALPPHVRVERGGTLDLGDEMAARGWDEVVIKKVVTGGAAGQLKASRAELAAGQAHLDALLTDGDVLVQPFIRSLATRGEVSLVAIDGRVVHAVRKIPGVGDYRTQANFGATVVGHRPTAAELALAERALAALAYPTLHARVDMVALDDGSMALMELEVIEPFLFLAVDPPAVERVAAGIVGRLGRPA